MTITLTFAELMMVLGFCLSFAVAFGGMLWSIYKRGETNRAYLEAKIDMDSKDLRDYKLIVAQQYASWSQIQEMDRKLVQTEERLYSAITNLTARIDRMLTRMEDKG